MIYYQQISKISKRLDNNCIVKFKRLCQKCSIKRTSLIPVYAQCSLHLPPPLNDTVFSTCCLEFGHTRPICNQSLSYVADLLMIPYGYSTNLFLNKSVYYSVRKYLPKNGVPKRLAGSSGTWRRSDYAGLIWHFLTCCFQLDNTQPIFIQSLRYFADLFIIALGYSVENFNKFG